MNLTKLVLKRSVSTALVILGIVVFGVFSMFNFDMELLPDINLPMMVVYTVYPGADADSVDNLVNSKIEDSSEALSGVNNVESYSFENYGMVALTYDYDTDMNDAYTNLSAALDALDLPDDAKDPTIIQMDVNAMDTVTISAVNNGSADMMAYINDTLEPQLKSVPNVAKVNVTGGRENYVRVKLNQDKMNQYGLSIASVGAAIGAADYNVPAGKLQAGSQDINVSTSAKYLNLDDLKHTVLTTSKGAQITVGDIAEVGFDAKKAESVSRYDGQDNVSVGVIKSQKASTVSVARAIKRKVEQLDKENPGVKLSVSYDAGQQITASLTSVAKTLILGVVLAMIVLFVFFGDWRASLIVGSSMPLSVFATLDLMQLFGFDLNVITTGSLVIAIGMIVDSSIVVIESIFRIKEVSDQEALEGIAEGADNYNQAPPRQKLKKVAERGARVVMLSITASTITTIVVYLPMTMIHGMAGQMFGQLGWIIVFAMLSSLISALCVVPLLYVAVHPKEKKDSRINHFLDRVKERYDKILRSLMRKRKTTIVATVAMLVVSLLLASTLDVELIPTSYDGSIIITTTYRSGTRLDNMSQDMEKMESMISKDKNFRDYTLNIAQNTATLTAYAVKDCKRSSAKAVEIYSDRLASLTNADVFVDATGGDSMTSGGSSSMGGGGSSANSLASNLINVVLEGDDQQALREGSAKVEQLMRDTPGILHITSDAASAQTSAHIVVDPLKAAAYGLTPASVAGDLYQTLTGLTAATMEKDGDNYDIILNYPDGLYQDVNDLMNKRLIGSAMGGSASSYAVAAGMSAASGAGGGGMGAMVGAGAMSSAASTGGVREVVLSDIAHISYDQKSQSIHKSNGKYQQTISAVATEDSKSAAKKEITEKAAKLKYPKGVGVSSSYMDNMTSENLSAIFYSILAAIFLVFLVMAMQFESPRFSLMVMTCIPFSLIGSFLLLFLTRSSLDMVSMMGFLMLMGIVVNNGILIVDTTNQERRRMSLEDALVTAGKIRLRPILMTTLTTILAMIPMAVTKSNEIMRGMAFVIIGGLVASTLLCLLLMPTFYLLIDKNARKQRRKARRAKQGKDNSDC